MANSQFFTYIDSLDISKGWKTVFKKIHVVYHENYSNGKNIPYPFWRMSGDFKKLSDKDRGHFSTNFNPFAFVLGPIYYLLKRMYVKGAILLALSILLGFFPQTRFLIVLILLYCAYFGNRDFFIEKVLKNKTKKFNPLILNDPPDKMFIYEALLVPHNYATLIIFVSIIAIASGYSLYSSIIKNYALQDYLESTPVVCSGTANCQEFILSSVREISTLKSKEDIAKKYYMIASAYISYGDLYNAINSLNRALDVDPNDISSLFLRANLNYKQKSYSHALIDYKAVSKNAPNANFIFFYEGRCFYQLGMYKEAAESFKRAAKWCRQPSYYEYWAYAEIQNGNKDEAIKILKKASKMYLNENGSQNVRKSRELDVYIANLEKSR